MLKDTRAFSGFAVPDLDAAQRFYGETLGLELDTEMLDNGLLGLKLAGGRDTLIYIKPDHEPATYTILNFQVDDIDATVDGLAERGVEFERYDMDETEVADNGVHRGTGPDIAWFKDPAGNILSVLTEGPA